MKYKYFLRDTTSPRKLEKRYFAVMKFAQFIYRLNSVSVFTSCLTFPKWFARWAGPAVWATKTASRRKDAGPQMSSLYSRLSES